MRRRHAGAIEVAPGVARQRTANLLARRHKIRLETSVPGRAPAREKADAVGVRPVAMRGADRDHAVGVAWIGHAERGVAFVLAFRRLEVLVTAIPGRRD